MSDAPAITRMGSSANASATDSARFGSGTKVLHNVVGGRIGVLEGNDGDLRFGLPLNSLHNRERWMRTPLRFFVFSQAPRSGIGCLRSIRRCAAWCGTGGFICSASIRHRIGSSPSTLGMRRVDSRVALGASWI